jgi:hypothetical protein
MAAYSYPTPAGPGVVYRSHRMPNKVMYTVLHVYDLLLIDLLSSKLCSTNRQAATCFSACAYECTYNHFALFHVYVHDVSVWYIYLLIGVVNTCNKKAIYSTYT